MSLGFQLAPSASAEAPLSLYIALEDGKDADLEVVSRAALAWADAIRQIAVHIDPTIQVEIKLHSGSEGSLSLNSIVRALQSGMPTKIALRAAVAAAAWWFTEKGLEYTFTEVLDYLRSEDAAAITRDLSEEELREIAEIVVREHKARIGEEAVEQLYRELERDRAITGVGATTVPEKRPVAVVPREEFGVRSSAAVEDEETVTRRTVNDHIEVVVIRAHLVNDTNKRWRFASPYGEFSATIKDQEFLDDALSGAARIPLVSGLKLDVLVRITEDKVGDLWQATDHAIVRVYGYERPPRQAQLDLRADPKRDDPTDDD